MWTRVKEIHASLNRDETRSLRTLARRAVQRIPVEHELRLIGLGLAELSMGQVALTIPGRQIVGLIGGE